MNKSEFCPFAQNITYTKLDMHLLNMFYILAHGQQL